MNPLTVDQPHGNTGVLDPQPALGPAIGRRKLIVCIDGTSNQFSEKNTNVIEMYSCIKKDDSQLTYYNSGIGTYVKPSWYSWSYIKQSMYYTIDLAIAWNLKKVILGAYRWLSDTYRTGDQIFLFGFSRGAYQVRALAAMVECVGLIYTGNQEQIPFAWELYASRESNEAVYKLKTSTFKNTFCRPSVDIHFLGAWDTVSSIGIFRQSLHHLTDVCSHITHFRHALALDECRVKFLPEYLRPEGQRQEIARVKTNTIKEVWFAGTHSDIGGGNKENLNLSNGAVPLQWMMSEAEEAGLVLSDTHQNIQANPKPITDADVTESLTGIWWILEYIPMSWYSPNPGLKGGWWITVMEYLFVPWASSRYNDVAWGLHRGEGRKVTSDQSLHWSVFLNHQFAQADGGYRPKAKFLSAGEVFDFKLDEGMFKSMPTARDTNLLKWEGDMDLVRLLQLIKEFDTPQHLPGRISKLRELRHHLTIPHKVDLIWVYGGASFLKKLAYGNSDMITKPLAMTIIRAVIGFRDVSKESKPLRQQIGPTDGNNATNIVSGDTDDVDIGSVSTLISRLNDLVPFGECNDDLILFREYDDDLAPSGEHAEHIPGHIATKLNPQPTRLISVLGWLISVGIPNRGPNETPRQPSAQTPRYPLELASIVIEMIQELLETEEYADQICLHKESRIVQTLPLLLATSRLTCPSPPPDYQKHILYKGEHSFVLVLDPLSLRGPSRSPRGKQDLDADLALQTTKAITRFAKHHEGRQKLLDSKVTRRLVPLLDIEVVDDVDKDLILQVMRASRALSEEKKAIDCLVHDNIVSHLVRFLTDTSLEGITIEALGTLKLVAQYRAYVRSPDLGTGVQRAHGPTFDRLNEDTSRGNRRIELSDTVPLSYFRALLVEQPVAGSVKELLDEGDGRFNEKSLCLIATLLDYDELRGKLVNSEIPVSLARFLKRATISKSILESVLAVSRHPELLSSDSELLATLIGLAQDEELTGFLKSLATLISIVARAMESNGNDQYGATTLSISALVDMAWVTGGSGLQTVLATIMKFLKISQELLGAASSEVVGIEGLANLVSWLLNRALPHHSKSSRYEIFDTIKLNTQGPRRTYHEIMSIVFDLVECLSQSAEYRKELLKLKAYQSVLRLSDQSVAYPTKKRASELLGNLQKFGEVNGEITKYRHYPYPGDILYGFSDTSDSDDAEDGLFGKIRAQIQNAPSIIFPGRVGKVRGHGTWKREVGE
ncbi:unnamed protein product [Rhizoctonia solani]|uniref:T6SS Phospholipase effector Tle1-like catalytic domain-containing protein n=1 Tax=Rhizoctonia solani TaxID=456999 RepID=A0A8H3AJA2_9AGAM|nr:unnamed protein product [Rhizoctonia solani]